MTADGHLDLVLAVGTAQYQFAVLVAGHAVNVEAHAVHRDSRAAVTDGAPHLEARHVDKVGVVDRQRSAADECRTARGV